MRNTILLFALGLLLTSCLSDFNGISPKDYVKQNNLDAVELDNGVYLVVHEEGDARRILPGEVALVDFRGILAESGETFRDEQGVAGLYENLFSGWKVALQEIGIGGSCTMVLPPDQAFGSQQQGDVPGKSTVVFELTLLDIITTATVEEYIVRNNLTTTELDKGVHISVIEPGSSKRPSVNSEVKVNYTGKLTNELIFDQGQEASFNLSNLIEGWQIGLPEIGEGGKCILVIPAEVGYGDAGAGNGAVPPDAPLVFEIELLEVGSAADNFVEANGLNTTLLAGGVHIIIHDEGDVDKKPDNSSDITVDYEGRLTNGDIFDSNEDVTFMLGGLIEGWQIGLKEIGEGGSCTLIIPPSAGYGNQQNGDIPPNSVLIFDITMKSVM